MSIWYGAVCAYCLFFFNDTATTEIYTLSLHDALPISLMPPHHSILPSSISTNRRPHRARSGLSWIQRSRRSEEHTSELQSRQYLVCRLLLEKKQPTPRLPRSGNAPSSTSRVPASQSPG